MRLGDGVGARGQVQELVEAVGVGGGRAGDGVARTVGAGERQHDAGDAGFGIAHAVVAGVLVDVARQLGGGVHTGVQRGVVLTLGQRDDLRLAGARVGVGVDGVKAVGADVGCGEDRAGGGRELHLVLLARRQAGEAVDAVGNRGGGGRGVADAVDQAVGAAADQRDRGADDADFTAVLLAVTIGVDPQAVAQAGRDELTKVVLDAVGARDQRDAAEHVVDRVGATGGAGGVPTIQITGGLTFSDGIGARPQIHEFVEAQSVGAGGQAHRLTEIVDAVECDRHASNGRLRIADTVIADIFIDIAGQLGRLNQACIDGLIGFTCRQSDLLAETRQDIGVAVRQVLAVAGGVADREQRTSGRDEFDLVVASVEAGELVVTLLNGSGCEVVTGQRAGHQRAIP